MIWLGWTRVNFKNLSSAFENFLETQTKSSRDEIVDSWCGQKKRSRIADIPGPSNKIQHLEADITEMKIEPSEGRKKSVHFGNLIIQVQPIPRKGNQNPVCRKSHSQKYRTKWPEKFK